MARPYARRVLGLRKVRGEELDEARRGAGNQGRDLVEAGAGKLLRHGKVVRHAGSSTLSMSSRSTVLGTLILSCWIVASP